MTRDRFDGPSEEADDFPLALPTSQTVGPWRRVAVGLFLKLFGQATGATGVLSLTFLWLLGDPHAPRTWWTAPVGLLAVAVLLDAAGRLLCLAAPPQLHARGTVLGSVLAQGGALLLVGLSLPWPFYDARLEYQSLRAVLLLLGLTAQFAAAYLFTQFLLAVAEHFEQPRLASQARALATALAALLVGLLTSGAVLLVLGLLVFVLGLLACWFAVFVWLIGGIAAAVLSVPFVAVTACVFAVVQGLYAVLVFSLGLRLLRATRREALDPP